MNGDTVYDYECTDGEYTVRAHLTIDYAIQGIYRLYMDVDGIDCPRLRIMAGNVEEAIEMAHAHIAPRVDMIQARGKK